MKVKRYVVNALPEALPMIRSELGSDAVILNTKEIRVGGFLGLFGKKRMEVIAAVEAGAGGSSKPAAPPARPSGTAVSAARTQSALAQVQAQAAAAKAASAAAVSKSMMAETPSAQPQASISHATANYAAAAIRASLQQEPSAATTNETVEDYAPVGSQKTNEDRAPLIAPALSNDAAARAAARQEELLAEMKDMKQWFMRMTKDQQAAQQPEAIRALRTRLEEQEVHNDIIDGLMSELVASFNDRDADTLSREEVWHAAEKLLDAKLMACGSEGIRPETRVVHFVGPTGVGKTTSIAKLAAEQSLKGGRKVGFITADTYRIAAVDQLRTYATILNLPLEVVFSPAEVTRAFKALADRELVFMDTAGRNFRNELYVSEVNSLLQSGERSETYLVLSLTGKFNDMSTVAEHFGKYGVQKALFTKQDETSTYGSIINLVLQQGIKPAYIAYGQTVPDDIKPFHVGSYIKQLLGAAE